jgi:hypothetical protein
VIARNLCEIISHSLSVDQELATALLDPDTSNTGFPFSSAVDSSILIHMLAYIGVILSIGFFCLCNKKGCEDA